ncbi:hypothetical protein [Shewanella seohaensis]|uniref:hypothetical protein n=1 Tax=Shewanella seohaensis TaxID=755175 RepID=UPI0035BA3DA6
MSFTEEHGSSIRPDTEHKYALEKKKLDLDAGFIGKFFGISNSAAINIAGLVALLLVISGIAVTFLDSKIPPENFWKIIIPVLSVILGYLFGKKA